jgi:hypothetical protein
VSNQPTADYVFDVGGVTVTMSFSVDEVPKILAWSTSEVILYLGSEGPLLQAGLRQVYGGE